MTSLTLFRNFIDGEWLESRNSFNNINPVNGQTIGPIFEANQSMVDQAVKSAKAALNNEWGKISDTERSHYLHKLADAIDKRFDDFVEAEIQDTGKSYHQASTIDIPRGSANFRIFADLIKAYPNESYETQTPEGSIALNYSIRRRLGVVAVISPWNLPFLLLTWKVAPALAAGNCIVAKPSEETPSSATLLAEIVQETGFPSGVFNLIHGFGHNSAGEYLVKHRMVDAITFTGESATGTAIMSNAAEHVKPISFELGGKNPAIIFEDCNLEKAIDGITRAVFTNSGQVCMCTERVYVHTSIFEKFVNGLKEKAEAIKIGSPDESEITMGPLISKAHQDKVLTYFKRAKEEGATIITGGAIPKFQNQCDQGFFVQPTIWTGLGDQSRINREEIFGPVCHITPFDTEEEAIKRANDTEYGLCASIWTENLSKGHRVAKKIEAGLVWVNSWYLRDLRTPFGGVKLSGIGREGGLHSLNFYSEPSNICIQIDPS